MNRFARLLLVLIATVLAASLGFAGPKPNIAAHKPNAHRAAAHALYACPKCDEASMHAGKCPMCGTKLAKIHGHVVYACKDCHTVAKHAGKCPKCGKPMTMAVKTFECDMCHITANHPGNCPKCGMTMTEKVLPMMKG